MRPLLPALALLMLSSSALAGPKPPATNTFEPEIGYTYASGNYMDLRLANRAGDKAVLVHRTAFGALGSFDLSDEFTKKIAYTDRGKLYLRSWQNVGGTVTIGSSEPLYLGPGRVEVPDFSPTGSRLAFSFGASPEFPDKGGIIIHDFNILDNPLTSDKESQTTYFGEWQIFTVRWHPDDRQIYFYGRPIGPNPNSALYLFDPPSGNIRLITFSGVAPFTFDTAHGQGAQDTPHHVALSDNNMTDFYADPISTFTNLARIGMITLAHFNCKESAVIARNNQTRRQSVAIIPTYPTIGQPVTWSTDSNIHHTDWMYRVPCT